MLEQIALLEPAINDLTHKSARLTLFNKLAIGLPYAAGATTLLLTNNLPLELFAGLALSSAITTQISRAWKGRIREEFAKIWNDADLYTRPLTLGYLQETMDTKIGQSKNIVAADDFNLKNKLNVHVLGTTLVTGLIVPFAAPIVYFTGRQLKEYNDSAKIDINARYTQLFYNHLKAGNATPPPAILP